MGRMDMSTLRQREFKRLCTWLQTPIVRMPLKLSTYSDRPRSLRGWEGALAEHSQLRGHPPHVDDSATLNPARHDVRSQLSCAVLQSILGNQLVENRLGKPDASELRPHLPAHSHRGLHAVDSKQLDTAEDEGHHRGI